VAIDQQTTLADLSVNTIRTLSIDAVQQANSGHPGAPLGLAPAAYVLWRNFLKHNPRDPQWPDRDRFVLSNGHASMLLYSLLYLTGYDVSLDDIKHFRQWESLTPGHPEYGLTAGVEVTTGPLGQGISNAVGFALAEAHLAANFNQVLGVNVQLQNVDSPTFMSRLTGRPSKIPFGWISYGMDYYDSSNMLGVWLQPGGRHTWDNAQYNQLVQTGSQLAGDPAKRTETMQSAEKLLVSDVPGIFVYHSLIGQLYKPFLKGDPLLADKFGYTGEEWPGFASFSLCPWQEYNTTDVTQYRKS